MTPPPEVQLRRLFDAWCERKELRPLSILLPPWMGCSGTPASLEDLNRALHDTLTICRDLLPAREIEILTELESNMHVEQAV